MKIVNGFLLAVLVTFSTSSFADAVYDNLSSGELVRIKQAAQQLTSGQGQTQQNLDLMAEIIFKKYKKSQLTEIDTLAWGTKALAASGDGRYRQLLTDIVNSGVHKKLRKYAKKALKSLPNDGSEQFVGGKLKMAKLKSSGPQKIGKYIPKPNLSSDERKLFGIASGDLHTIKSLAQESEVNGATIKVYDGLVQYLLMHSKSASEYNVDTLAWICRALGSSGNGRYTKSMEEVLNTTNSKKLRKYAQRALDSLPDAKNSYQFGSVNFNKIIEMYKS